MSNSVYKRNESESNLLFEDLHDNIGDDSEDCPTVNILVRRSYYEHLKKLLVDNVNFCQKNNLYFPLNLNDVHKCAQQMELRALKASMVTELYRSQMLKEIRIIRENTQNGLLFINNPAHCEILEKSCSPDNTNVTDNYNISDNPPQNANDNICVQAPNILIVENLPKTITTVDNPNTDSPDVVAKDGIMEKLQNIFGSEDNELIETIFGVNDENIQITSNQLNTKLPTNQSTSTAINSPGLTLDDHPYIGCFQKKTVRKYSFWGLEEYIQSAVFRQKMFVINEMNPVKYERVMNRLTNYFGDDSNIDLQTPVNLEELKCVCRDRISHFVVSCLTSYYKSRIRSREIFKVLSRSMTTVILQLDPYINAAVVHKSIKEMFLRHRSLSVKTKRDVEHVTHHIKFYISRDCN